MLEAGEGQELTVVELRSRRWPFPFTQITKTHKMSVLPNFWVVGDVRSLRRKTKRPEEKNAGGRGSSVFVVGSFGNVNFFL